MNWVIDLKYLDKEGDEIPHSEEEWKRESIHLDYICPFCKNEQDRVIEYPVKQNTKITCTSCKNQYFLKPTVTATRTELFEWDLKGQIELQLSSINRVKDIVKRNPVVTTELSFSPKTAVLTTTAMISTTLSFFIIFFQSISEGVLINDLYLLGGVVSFGFGIIAGYMALFKGSLGTLLRGYQIYKDSDYQEGYYQFIIDLGNYNHTVPFRLI